jgi:hypothetical protein
MNHLLMSGQKLIQSAPGFLEQRPPRGILRLLREEGNSGSGVKANLPLVRLVQPGQETKQGGLAHAVWSYQPDPFTGRQLEGEVLKQGSLIKTPSQPRTT